MNSTIPVEHTDPINAPILAISEDLIAGFQRQPFHVIAEKSGVPLGNRARAHPRDGRGRHHPPGAPDAAFHQTRPRRARRLEGAGGKAQRGFDFMSKEDPFSGHVVIRSTDTEVSGSGYRLWTTLKVPVGESLDDHATALLRLTGATEYLLMPANGVFALGVGHVRRKTLEPGDKADEPAVMMTTATVDLTPEEWEVLLALKEELTLDEICENPWDERAEIAGVSLDRFCEVAETLNAKKVIGRFSTFLEHVKPSATGERVTRFNGLFHWAVPKGREIEAGGEVGRHFCMTHCYWREGGPQFGNVNIMGVVHGTEKDRVLEHKAAIDRHLAAVGIPVSYTNVFWGGRSEIKPSEISPKVYAEWHAKHPA